MSSLRWRAGQVFRRALGVNRLLHMALAGRLGQVSLLEARFLGELVRDLTGPGPIVEIGTLFGTSTKAMVLYKALDRELITVDAYVWNPFNLAPNDHFQATSEALAEAVTDHRVSVVRKDKDAFYSEYTGPPPSLVFLDADHSFEATAADIAWARKVGAEVIALHDYGPHCDGVVKAVDAVGGPSRLIGTIAVLKPAVVGAITSAAT